MPVPALAAFLATGFFVALMILFGRLSAYGQSPPPQVLILVGTVIAVAFHLLLLPVIANLAAPDWAKAAGYGWIVVDIACSIMTLNGVANSVTTALRYGGHVPAAVWIAAAAWNAGGAARYVGVALAVCLGGYSFLAPWVPFVGFVPAIVLMIAWLPLVGRHLLKG